MIRYNPVKTSIHNLSSNICCDLSYVVEGAAWSIREDGRQIVGELNRQRLLKSRITDHPIGLWGQIVHFGSDHLWFENRSSGHFYGKPRVITVFHIVDDRKAEARIVKMTSAMDLVHTSCNLTLKKLVDLGVPRTKIAKVPLGVDISLFSPPSECERAAMRRKLEIPDGALAIGSFQKDGVGWSDGDTPKLIKGPDVLCDVLEILARRYPVHAVLIGPARGYVKQRLTEAGIPYTHRYIEDFKEVSCNYHALDLYLVTSRIEGGPKAVLESMASGVPLITTAVGMAPEVVEDGHNGRLCHDLKPEAISAAAASLVDDTALRNNVIRNGLATAKRFAWPAIATRYYHEVYAPLIG